jgi:hypothetical protein
MDTPTPPPWYRQFWPWLLILLPASAVIASLFSLYLAITRPDALVHQSCVRDGVMMKCGESTDNAAP